MITRDTLPWAATDSEQLRHFLETEAGQRLLPKVVEACAPLLPGGESNAILIRSGEVRGFQAAISAILSLANPPAPLPEEPTSYPSLDDDSKWKHLEAGK